MSSDGHEPDRLWHWIDEQKRPQTSVSGRGLESDTYSHDAKQNWVQAVSASLRTGRRRPKGSKSARKRLEDAIQLSLQSKYPRSVPASRPAHRNRRALLVAAWLLLLSAALAAYLVLTHTHQLSLSR